MFNYIRLTGEGLVFLAAVVSVVSVPLTTWNFATYLGTLYIFVSDIMYLYGLKKSQDCE
mgnify:CR=1 FL=1